MLSLLLVWLLNSVALLVVAYILPGIAVASFGSAMIAALVLGLLNALVKPILVFLTLPITILTLGLFLLVLNALLFWFAGSLLPGFKLHRLWWAVLGALLSPPLPRPLTSMLCRTHHPLPPGEPGPPLSACRRPARPPQRAGRAAVGTGLVSGMVGARFPWSGLHRTSSCWSASSRPQPSRPMASQARAVRSLSSCSLALSSPQGMRYWVSLAMYLAS